jgi:hypothetical protein
MSPPLPLSSLSFPLEIHQNHYMAVVEEEKLMKIEKKTPQISFPIQFDVRALSSR